MELKHEGLLGHVDEHYDNHENEHKAGSISQAREFTDVGRRGKSVTSPGGVGGLGGFA